MTSPGLINDTSSTRTMAASEFSFEFVPGYFQLIQHTYVVWKQFIDEMMNSDYSFPSSTVSDLKKYCRFDLADIILIVIMTVAWTILRWLTTEAVFKPLVTYFQLLPSDRKKAPESFWKLLFYTGTVSYNAYLLFFTEEYNFFHRPGFVWEGWTPGMVIGPEVYFYYMIQGSFYVHSIFATIFMDLWRKDSFAMLGHHFITCGLIFLSYGFRYCNIGILVFLLHDVTDVELEFTKLNVYFKRRGGKFYSSHEYISIFGFIAFTGTWLIARLYWFPTRALYSSGVLALGKLHLPFSPLLTVMLWLIFSLNVYWFLYIVVFLVKVVTGQVSELVDTREFDSPVKSTPAMNGKNSHNGVHCSKIANNIEQ